MSFIQKNVEKIRIFLQKSVIILLIFLQKNDLLNMSPEFKKEVSKCKGEQ